MSKAFLRPISHQRAFLHAEALHVPFVRKDGKMWFPGPIPPKPLFNYPFERAALKTLLGSEQKIPRELKFDEDGYLETNFLSNTGISINTSESAFLSWIAANKLHFPTHRIRIDGSLELDEFRDQHQPIWMQDVALGINKSISSYDGFDQLRLSAEVTCDWKKNLMQHWRRILPYLGALYFVEAATVDENETLKDPNVFINDGLIYGRELDEPESIVDQLALLTSLQKAEANYRRGFTPRLVVLSTDTPQTPTIAPYNHENHDENFRMVPLFDSWGLSIKAALRVPIFNEHGFHDEIFILEERDRPWFFLKINNGDMSVGPIDSTSTYDNLLNKLNPFYIITSGLFLLSALKVPQVHLEAWLEMVSHSTLKIEMVDGRTNIHVDEPLYDNLIEEIEYYVESKVALSRESINHYADYIWHALLIISRYKK